MKKPYIQPTTMVVKMQVTQFVMTTSLPVDPNTGTGTQLAPEFYFDEED